MKKSLIALLILLFSINLEAQSIKSMEFHNQEITDIYSATPGMIDNIEKSMIASLIDILKSNEKQEIATISLFFLFD